MGEEKVLTLLGHPAKEGLHPLEEGEVVRRVLEGVGDAGLEEAQEGIVHGLAQAGRRWISSNALSD